MEYYFYQLAYQDSKVPKCFVGLIQMQCSPSLTACGHHLHPRFWVLQEGKCLSYPPDCIGKSLKSQIAWAASVLHPLQTPFNRGTPSLKLPQYSLFTAEKLSTIYAIFMGLCLTIITNIWNAL